MTEPALCAVPADPPPLQRCARHRADHAVGHEPARGLEALDRGLGEGAEVAVRGDAERRLRGRHGRALAAEPQIGAGDAGGRSWALGEIGGGDDDERGQERRGDRAHRQPGAALGLGAAAAGAGERAIPQLVAAQVAPAGGQRPDRPTVVMQRHCAHRPDPPVVGVLIASDVTRGRRRIRIVGVMDKTLPQRPLGSSHVGAIGLGCMGMSWSYTTGERDDDASLAGSGARSTSASR